MGVSPNGFQDRLVMTTSISLRVYDTRCCIYTRSLKDVARRTLFVESTSHTPPEVRQACLSDAGCGYLRLKAKYPSVNIMYRVHLSQRHSLYHTTRALSSESFEFLQNHSFVEKQVFDKTMLIFSQNRIKLFMDGNNTKYKRQKQKTR